MRPLATPAPRSLGLAWLLALLAWGGEARAAQVLSLFPTDQLTVADPAQLTGRRVALPLPRCSADPAGCDEVQLLNQLDGFSVTPRLALRFSAPITLDSVTREGAFILPLWGEPLPSPVGLDQLVWSPETLTLYARPERALLQGRRYALVVTSRVVDDDSRRLQPAPDPGWPREGTGDGAALAARIRIGLEALGVKRSQVVALALFTTQSVTADLERMRAVIEGRPAPELRFTRAPGGERSVYARADLRAIELRPQVAASGGGALGEPLRLPLALIPPEEVGTVAFGRLQAASFLSRDRHIPAVPSRNGDLRPTGEEELHVTVLLPAGPMPEGGWPVAIFGHGWGGDRHSSLLAVTATLARHGVATGAINVVGHGGGPAGTLTLGRERQPPVVLPAGGRGLDLDGDGRIERTEGVGTRNQGPLALLSIRDGLKQTTADLMQLVRAIRRGVDVDGDGRPDLDRERIYYFGQSLGGIYGTLLMAVEPAIRVGVLNVAGGPIVEIARQSPLFRGLVARQIQARRPSLMNGEKDFYEFVPLPGQPPVRSPLPGALELQAYFDRADWLGQSANPVAFAPYLRQAPLTGVGPKAVLYQYAVGDLTVPNPTTESILRAGDLHLFSSAYRHDRIAPPLGDRFRNPHTFLTWIGRPEVAAIGRAAQEQVARFFLSGGRRIERTDDRFEVQLAPPAAR